VLIAAVAAANWELHVAVLTAVCREAEDAGYEPYLEHDAHGVRIVATDVDQPRAVPIDPTPADGQVRAVLPDLTTSQSVVDPVPAASEPVEEPEAPQVGGPADEPLEAGHYECVQCGDRFRGPSPFGRHMRTDHGEEIAESYAEGGAAGLVRDFGVSEGTARRWVVELELAAA
jgi:hypothetical protein